MDNVDPDIDLQNEVNYNGLSVDLFQIRKDFRLGLRP
jgi:hypothetical protein